MKINEEYFLSNDKSTNIHMVTFIPEEKTINGVIQISHGVTEHIMRYTDFAEYFTDNGFIVVGIDLLGHGLSTNNGRKQMYFGPSGSWNYVVEDINTCFKITKERYHNVPYIMLGFSLGSFLLRSFLIKYPNSVDASIIIGTGYTNPILLKLVKKIAIKESKTSGEEYTTKKIKDLTFGTYNKKFAPNKTDFDWLLSSEYNLNNYIKDPLRGKYISCGLFREMCDGMIYTELNKNIKKMNKNMPILLLSGSNDSVGNCGKSIIKIYNKYQKSGIKDISYKLYNNLRHDILHEDNKLLVYNDIKDWIINKINK